MKKILENIAAWIKSPKSDRPLLVVAIILLNLVSIRGFVRFDLTQQKSFSLTKMSRQFVASIEQPLSIKVFFSDNLPSPYNFVSQYLKDLLVEYKASANKNFSYTFYDMDKEENVKIAHDLGLGPVQVEQAQTTELSLKSVWMGLAITYGDTIKTIGSIKTSADLEYKITTMISSMVSVTDSLLAMKEDEKIDILLYYPEVLKSYNIPGFNELKPLVETKFAELNQKNYNRLNLKVIDPDNAAVTDAINRYGLPGVYIETDKTTTTLGLVIDNHKNFTILPVRIAQGPFGTSITNLNNLEDLMNDGLEYLLTNTMEIGYITGHGENPLRPAPYAQNNQSDYTTRNFYTILSDLYTVEEIDLKENEFIPATLKTVIVNNPHTQFTEKELYALDQFLMGGGNILYFVPGCGEQGLEQGIAQKPDTGLEKLFASYGITINQDIVLDQNCFSQLTRDYGKQELLWAPVVPKKNLDSKNPVTQFLANVIFYNSSSIDVSKALENNEAKTTVLAKSSPKSWVLTDNIILYPGYLQPPQDQSLMEEKNLAVLMEGKFSSAFTPDFNSHNSGNGIASKNHLEKSIQSGKVIVVSSGMVTSDMLIDPDCYSEMALFTRNLVDYANGLSDYCAMRTKNNTTNFLNISSKQSADTVKFLNQFGLSIVIILIGFIVYRMKLSRKQKIHDQYNPEDKRLVSKKEADNE
ncbi:MAG: Gldg family protein [Treponema sp.]|nr:Gldg family protein [Treponema sp.]